MSEIREWVHGNLKDARELIGSGVEGAKSAIERSDAGVDFAESTRASWKAAVVGATIGVVAGVLSDDRKPSRGGILGGIIGAAFGLGVGLAWETREPVRAALHGATEKMSAVRDSQWLARHPIDYA
jgi:hypothetical protein